MEVSRRWARLGWRTRVLAATLPVAVVLLGSSLVVPRGSGETGAPTVPGATRTRCLDVARVDSVRSLDRFARTVRGNSAFAGGDVGASAALQDGRQLFVFGDTLRAASFDGQRLVRNSMLVASDRCAAVVLPADQGALVPDRGDGVGYWPMSVVTVPGEGYDLVGVTLQRVRNNDDVAAGGFAFDILGPAWAYFVVPAGGVPQLVSVEDLGPDEPDPRMPMWGAATAVQGDWIYLYGTARPPEATSAGFSVRVARTRVEAVTDRTAWRYWDGEAWQADPARAAELIPAVGGVSQTFSVFRAAGRWYAVSKRDEVLGTDLTVWTAPAPTGPFTVASVPVQIPSDGVSGTLRYMPLAHPDLLPRPGTVVVSYSENNTDLEVVQDDPRRYRPRFIRVRLPR